MLLSSFLVIIEAELCQNFNLIMVEKYLEKLKMLCVCSLQKPISITNRNRKYEKYKDLGPLKNKAK